MTSTAEYHSKRHTCACLRTHRRSLEGQKLASFTGVGAFVRRAFEDALAGILHKRTVDMLLDIRKAQVGGLCLVCVCMGAIRDMGAQSML